MYLYGRDYPEPGEVVMVQVDKEDGNGYYVSLLEYNNKQGMIFLTELSRKKIKSKKSIISIGMVMPLIVLKVDKDKGYIDLSKKRLSEDDIEESEEKFKYASYFARIGDRLTSVYNEKYKQHITYKDMMNNTVWHLYENNPNKDKYLKELYNAVLVKPDLLFKGFELDKEFIPIAIETINNHIVKTMGIVEATFELTSYEEDGVTRLVSILTTNIPDVIHLISPPMYKIIVECESVKEGKHKIKEIEKQIQKNATSYDGNFKPSQDINVVKNFGMELKW